MLLGKEVSKASIAKIVGVSRTALHHFIRTRKLNPKASKGRGRKSPHLNLPPRHCGGCRRRTTTRCESAATEKRQS